MLLLCIEILEITGFFYNFAMFLSTVSCPVYSFGKLKYFYSRDLLSLESKSLIRYVCATKTVASHFPTSFNAHVNLKNFTV